MKIEELKPIDAKFKLSQFGDHEFTIKKFALSDEIWLNQTFGQSVEEIFKNVDMDAISRIIFHQLDIQDKLMFQKQTVKIMSDDTGEVVESVVGGYRLLQACIPGGGAGAIEKQNMLLALLECFGISRPQIAAITDEKKSNIPEVMKSTGGSSLTNSVANMDGPSNIALP